MYVIGITGGVGFMLAIVLFASVRERVEFLSYSKQKQIVLLSELMMWQMS